MMALEHKPAQIFTRTLDDVDMPPAVAAYYLVDLYGLSVEEADASVLAWMYSDNT